MKRSRYNIFNEYYDNKEKVIAYNSMTNALALMSKENYDKFINSDIENLKCDNDFYDKLVKGGYLVDDDFNELTYLSYCLLRDRYSTKALGLTIAPTIDCNFNCIYCFQKDGKDNLYMSKNVQDNIITFIKQQANNIEDLSIVWYGGEPLLNMQAIEYLSENILEVCEKNNVRYYAYMVTNGYNLTEEIVKRLRELQVLGLQVTIDGTEKIHNERRPLVGGQGTFRQILKNVKVAAEHIEDISLRINVDKENINETSNLIKYLMENDISKCAKIYLAPVDNTNECYENNLCLEQKSFSDLTLDIYDDLVENEGYSEKINYPRLITNSCIADTINGLLIDPTGLLYKCWCDIGIEDMAIGSLNPEDTERYNRTLFNEYMMYDATKDEICKECDLLPICMGGCPRKRIDGTNRCTMFKTDLDKKLQWMADKLLKKQKECTVVNS